MSPRPGTKAISDPVLVHFAIPGDLSTPTGGYVYARCVIRAAAEHGVELRPLQLPDGFPDPSAAEIDETSRAFRELYGAAPVLIDGLAGAVMPVDVLNQIAGRKVMLCHHPLALETGVPLDRRDALLVAETAALSACDHVITTSHATGEILKSDFGVAGDRLTVAPPGTDPAPRAKADGPCRIVSVGSLTPRKGHERLIDALAGIKDSPWSLRIIGPHRDAQTVEKVTALIEAHQLGDRVRLDGALPAAAVIAAYQSADLFALASEYEGFGMAFAEAMSHGLPVIGLHCDAVAEATAGGAHLVDADAFADALQDLVADTDARRALSDRSWTTAQSFLRWPQTAAIIAATLKRETP
ncbi:MAG: glycosyltransferase family 4 protein [Paracoccaceae bacterium]